MSFSILRTPIYTRLGEIDCSLNVPRLLGFFGAVRTWEQFMPDTHGSLKLSHGSPITRWVMVGMLLCGLLGGGKFRKGLFAIQFRNPEGFWLKQAIQAKVADIERVHVVQ